MQEINALEILKKELQRAIKEEITNRIIEEEIKQFKEKITPKIEEYVGLLTFDHIENFKNYMDLKTEFHVFLHWKNDGKYEAIEKRI